MADDGGIAESRTRGANIYNNCRKVGCFCRHAQPVALRAGAAGRFALAARGGREIKKVKKKHKEKQERSGMICKIANQPGVLMR